MGKSNQQHSAMAAISSKTHVEGCNHHVSHRNSNLHAYSGSPPLSPPPNSPLPPLPTTLTFRNLGSSTSSNYIQRPRKTLRSEAHPRNELQAIEASLRLQRKTLSHSVEDEEISKARKCNSRILWMKDTRMHKSLQLRESHSLAYNPLAAFTFTEEVLTALPNYFEPVIYASRQYRSAPPSTSATEHLIQLPYMYYCLPSSLQLEKRHLSGKSIESAAVPAGSKIHQPSGCDPQPARQRRAISAGESARRPIVRPASQCSLTIVRKQSSQDRPHLQIWNFPHGQPGRPEHTFTITDLRMHLGERQDTQFQFHDLGTFVTETIDSSESSAISANDNTCYRPQHVHKSRSSPGGRSINAEDSPKNSQASPPDLIAKQLGPVTLSRKRVCAPGNQHVVHKSVNCEHVNSLDSPSRVNTKGINTEPRTKQEENGSRLERNSEPEELDEETVIRSKKFKVLWAIATILLVLTAAGGILAGIVWRLKTLDRDD